MGGTPKLPHHLLKTLLLIAGRSRRFWPLREKSFFPICGKTLLEHQVERLRAGGCKEITLVGGEHNLKEAKRLFPTLKCIRQKDLELGMQGALLSALPSCKKEAVMVVSANDVIEPDAYKELRAAAKQKKVAGVILARTVKTYFPGGYLTVKGSRATGIVEKPGAGKEPGNLVNIVAHVHNDASILLNELKNVRAEPVGAYRNTPLQAKDDGYEQALAKLMQIGIYRIVHYRGLWQAVKYPWHLLDLLPVLLGELGAGSIHRSAAVHASAVIEGNVVLEEGVRVLPHAMIIGPCTIGRGTVIGTGVLVRGSSIGENCVIGFGTEVKSSVMGSDVWAHMAYIGDSVIGANVALASGSITGNLRLDEGEISSQFNSERIATNRRKFGNIIGENCRIGIHVGMNPGVKIGSGVFIGSGVMVNEDIPDGSFVKLEKGAAHTLANKIGAPLPNGRMEFREKAGM